MDDVGQQPTQVLVADPGISARPLGPGAVVVEILLLLELGRDRASAAATGQETGERMSVLGVERAVCSLEDLLDSIEERTRDQRLVVESYKGNSDGGVIV
jgi:hypothetical protein